MAGPDTEIVFLGEGETQVELISGPNNRDIKPGRGISIGFVAKSLEDVIGLLREKGYKTDGIIFSPNPNTSFFFAQDPDGYMVQFMKA